MNYGCVVFWGISTADEQALMHTVVRPCSVGPLDVREVEIDSFSYNYSSHEPPHVQVGVGWRGLARSTRGGRALALRARRVLGPLPNQACLHANEALAVVPCTLSHKHLHTHTKAQQEAAPSSHPPRTMSSR
jgi:hypothetical protein